MLASLLASFALLAGLGPDIGTAVPGHQRFEPMMGERGATLVFVRSVDWCPYCQTQVIELDAKRDGFAEAGRPLVVISYDTPALQEAFAEKRGVEASFIADEGSSLIRAFGLLNESHEPGSRAHGIPHPAVFVIDREGIVQAKLFEEDYATNTRSYRNRPAAETILEAARTR